MTARTIANWKRRGSRGHQGKYFQFFLALKKAEAECVVTNLAVIEKASRNNWTAAAWKLERLRPDRFGRRERREVAGSVAVGGLPGMNAEQQDMLRRLTDWVEKLDDASVLELYRIALAVPKAPVEGVAESIPERTP